MSEKTPRERIMEAARLCHEKGSPIGDYAKAVSDPAGIIERLQRGAHTKADLEVLVDVYPMAAVDMWLSKASFKSLLPEPLQKKLEPLVALERARRGIGC